MPTELITQWKRAIAEGSDTAMLVAADNMEESADIVNVNMSKLLRMYVDGQTYFRMSQTPPPAFGKLFQELQAEFKIEARKVIDTFSGCEYHTPLGPYYLGLTAGQTALANHTDWMSQEPVRELQIIGLRAADPDLAMILRNYRMESMLKLSLRAYGGGTPAEYRGLCEALKGLNGQMMQQITIRGFNDRQKHLLLHFNMNPKIAKGCELWHSPGYNDPVRLGIKKR